MEIKIITLINLLLYSAIVSQPLSYIISLTNVQQNMDATTYTQFRQLTDKNFQRKFRLVIYGTLISESLLLIVSCRHVTGILFITAAIALIALIADIIIALKINLPINSTINTWSENNYPANWKSYRERWLQAFYKRQVLDIAGFICLLVGAIFGE